jgi:transcriptional regulator with XRE-family HTH domain
MTQVSSADLPPRTAPLGERLDAALTRAGMSQSELARQLKTDRSVVGRWLKGTRITSKRHLRALPRILDTPAEYWLELPAPDRLELLEQRIEQLEQAVFGQK